MKQIIQYSCQTLDVLYSPALTSKMIIDATRYDAKAFPPVCLPAAEAMEKVEREWRRYGIAKDAANKRS